MSKSKRGKSKIADSNQQSQISLNQTPKSIISEKSKKDSRINVAQEGTLDSTLKQFWGKYSKIEPKLKMIDMFIIFLVFIILTQFFYRIVVGDDFPKNAFISGTFTPIGVIILLVSLRKNHSVGYRVIGQFFLAVMVLFVVGINFAG